MHSPIRRGSAIDVNVDIRNPRGRRVDADTVTVTVRHPNGTAVVDDAAMTELRLGVFTYAHQTSTGDPIGTWTAEVRVVEAGRVSLSLPMSFSVVAA